LFLAEITRDNNGSLSDSSFDVESEENFDRRRAYGQASHSPSSGAAVSRTVNNPHQHRRDRDPAVAPGGRMSSRQHGGPPTASYAGRHQPHDTRRHNRGDPDPAPDRRSAPGPGAAGDYRTGRGRGGSHGGVGGGSGTGGAKAMTELYTPQQSRLFVALFDYDPQTM